MITRRRFLGAGGVGALALSSACYPPMLRQAASGFEIASDALQNKILRKHLKSHMLGYPINMNDPADGFFAWREELFKAGIDAFAFNNVGNPFKASPILYNTHNFEREVILKFGQLFAFPTGDTWGFLSHSGTDSNMHGMYMGRTLLKGRTGVLPKAYFTLEAHYSVQILRDLLGLEAVIVDTQADGGMSPSDLACKLDENSNAPALVVATVGTTFIGAIDRIDRLREKLSGHDSYLHVDAALFGGYLPFTDYAHEVAYQDSLGATGRYDSIAVSCHKFFGFPSPAGLFVTKQSTYDEFNELFSQIHNPEYIHHVPGTITCSRDAVKPAEFYYFTTTPALARQASDAKLMLRNADLLESELKRRCPQLSARRTNPLSNTVFFKSPGEAVVKKYSLATMHLHDVDRDSVQYAHVVVMPHATEDILDEFLRDVEKARS